jgi:hypothetical protein
LMSHASRLAVDFHVAACDPSFAHCAIGYLSLDSMYRRNYEAPTEAQSRNGLSCCGVCRCSSRRRQLPS